MSSMQTQWNIDSTKSVFLVGASIACYFFYSIMQLSLFNIISDNLLLRLQITSVELGFLSSVYFYSLVLTLLPVGFLLDRFSTKSICTITFSLSVTAAFLLASTATMWTVIIYKLITGMANGVAFLASLRVASIWYKENVTVATGMIISFAMSGGIFSAVFLAPMFQYFGWKPGLWANALVGVLLLCFMIKFLRDHPKQSTTPADSISLHIVHLKQVILNIQNSLSGAYIGLLNLSVYVLATLWGDLYLTQRYDFSKIESSFISSMIFFGIIVGSPLSGYVSDKLKSRKIPMVTGALLSVIAITVIIYCPILNFYTLSLLFLILGITTSSQVIGYSVLAESNQLKLRSTATGFAAVILNLIGATSQPLFGILLSYSWDGQLDNNVPSYTTSDLVTAMLLLPTAFIIAMLAALLIKGKNNSLTK